ncbi:hypothetical protein LJY25_19285 [Hymenobacter sp. BT175]|uniref:hypothetical protein n=1 Tax=Hymenobacter translucens TaxID=2886507 RepID=UPI001D0F2C39|nr:hypothetical protein [Hymenobacter translucens]MCC2548600.1 hypothetical protein [Hymenobacter translucens]
MANPSAPLNEEAARLFGLRSFDALAAFAEPMFDEYVALAARLFQVPISLLSVVEEADVSGPANVGMPGHSQQPRAEALCATAISQARAVVYHDVALEHHPPIPAQALESIKKCGAVGLSSHCQGFRWC